MTKLTKFLMMFILAFALTSCYHPDIQQGNDLSSAQVQQLKLGMSKADVIQLLGTPVLQNVFNPDQLVYIYTDLPNHGNFSERKMILVFSNDKLTQINGASSFTA